MFLLLLNMDNKIQLLYLSLSSIYLSLPLYLSMYLFMSTSLKKFERVDRLCTMKIYIQDPDRPKQTTCNQLQESKNHERMWNR